MWIRVILVLILGLVILSTGEAYAKSNQVNSLNVLEDGFVDSPEVSHENG